MKTFEEKEYNCPNCDSDKPDFRGECPECHYEDKKLDTLQNREGGENL